MMNSGASKEATSSSSQSISEWKQNAGIDPTKQIKLVKLAHIRYQHPELTQITQFLSDFGMHVALETENRVWFRGTGSDQYVYFAQKGPKGFLGGAFEVESYEELVKASHLPGAGEIQSLQDAPGGGFMVTLPDPEGIPVNFIFGQEPAETMPLPENLIVNYGQTKARVGKSQCFKEGAAAVHKLGHFGIYVLNFERQLKWYTENFNIVPTDFLYVQSEGEDRKTVTVFAHIDRGEDYVDHHSMFLGQATSSRVHHCSFEVHDFDSQQLGHQWLAKKGYNSVWGVGRHILGSQIFDYWWDTSHFMVEHYTDGDVVNINTPIGLVPAGKESMYVWGPDVPDDFL